MRESGNNDDCGRCKTKHGGNGHYCPVHGPVSNGCCETQCRPEEWRTIPTRHPAYGMTYPKVYVGQNSAEAKVPQLPEAKPAKGKR